MELIDIGSNLTHESFAADLPAVLQRAREAGVRQQIVTGTSVQATQAAIELCRRFPGGLFATAGVHPHHASELDGQALPLLAQSAQAVEVVAVGECGLDYFRNFSPHQDQRRAFVQQLELAIDTGKPAFLHQRDAHADFLAIVREHRGRLAGAVAHCFTGTAAELDEYLALDLHIGITGWICDERRGEHLKPLMARIPAGRLMIETDAPYLLPRSLRPRPASRRNEPAFLPEVLRVVAEARQESVAELAAATTATARAFFNLPD